MLAISHIKNTIVFLRHRYDTFHDVLVILSLPDSPEFQLLLFASCRCLEFVVLLSSAVMESAAVPVGTIEYCGEQM